MEEVESRREQWSRVESGTETETMSGTYCRAINCQNGPLLCGNARPDSNFLGICLMFSESNSFAEYSDYLIAWTGYLNQRELEEYIHEPGGRNDNEAQSDFGQDLGRWYDNDFIAAIAENSASSIKSLVKKLYSDDELLIDEIEQHANSLGINEPTTIIILWNAKLLKPMEQNFANGKIIYLGSWTHTSPIKYE